MTSFSTTYVMFDCIWLIQIISTTRSKLKPSILYYLFPSPCLAKTEVGGRWLLIKPHGRMSAAKKAVWRTSMLFTGTTNSLFSTTCISITTQSISIIFTYFMLSIYATLHTEFEENQLSSSWDMCSWKLPHFLHIFLLCTVSQKLFLANQRHPSHGSISFKFVTPIRYFLAYHRDI